MRIVAVWMTFIFYLIQLQLPGQLIDTTSVVNLPEIEVKEYQAVDGVKRMPDMKDNIIYAGKKNEVIQLDKINADLSTNNTRQVFAKVPGMSIWENDGSGIQVSVAARGLSPNRSWEFNVRQNGYDISAEIFGYPESYYAPPMEAVSKIEVVRGAASLQFGPQFGGLLNYVLKKGDPSKSFSVETQQTIGSYGLRNTYNAIGGTLKRLSYYGFFHHRNADGWRKNSGYNIHTAYLSLNYQLAKRIQIGMEMTRMDYKSQQPGGLTESQFEENHKQSFRDRNWFNAPWNVGSLQLKFDVSEKFSIQLKSFVTAAQRNSVGFTKVITMADSINATTMDFNPRQVDRDRYFNYGAELRLSARYTLLNKEHVFASGIRAYNGNTWRYQLGKGTTSGDLDFSITHPVYERSLEFGTINYAAFAENIFQIGERLKVIPGMRLDYVESSISGYINTTATGKLNDAKRTRQILLYGIGSELAVGKKTSLYSNYSVAYRPVTFSELTPSATTEVIDENLKDASGFNADLGYRGAVKNYLSFDVGVFYLNYDNRIGVVSQNGSTFRTNIGTSVSKGIESYIEMDIVKLFNENAKSNGLRIFSSNSFIDARYVKWNNPTISNDAILGIQNKRVENAPRYIHRCGITFLRNDFSATFQWSNVGMVFTDAANTELSNAAGTIGKLPGYQLMDASFTYRFMGHFNIKGGVNNLTDEKYATRRSTGYPGPGILPGNGRTVYFSFGVNV